MSDEIIGPALPPHLAAKLSTQVTNNEDVEDGKKEKNNKRKEVDTNDEVNHETNQQNNKRRKFGPSLEDLLKPVNNEENTQTTAITDEEEDTIGPMLPSLNDSIEAEKRSDSKDDEEWDRVIAKSKEAQNEKIDKRENWMLSLPESNALRGGFKDMMRSKKAFNKNESAQMDNTWTMLPSQISEYESKNQKPASSSSSSHSQSSFVISSAPKQNTSNKQPSLLELHEQNLKSNQKNQKKTTNQATTSNEEPPKYWDRERDLVNFGKQLSSSKQREIVDQAKYLSSRFSTGRQ